MFVNPLNFNQKDQLKSYIDINTELRKNSKNDLGKDLFKLIFNAVFGKTMENVGKPRDVKLLTSEARRDYLVLEPNYYTTKIFSDNSLAIEMKKTHTNE